MLIRFSDVVFCHTKLVICMVAPTAFGKSCIWTESL